MDRQSVHGKNVFTTFFQEFCNLRMGFGKSYNRFVQTLARHLPPYREKEKRLGSGSLFPFMGRGPARGDDGSATFSLNPGEGERMLN